MPDDKPGTPVLRADATDDLDEIEAQVAGITDAQVVEKFRELASGPVPEFAEGGIVSKPTRLICAVCGLAAGTCGHQSSMAIEVPE